MEKHALLPWIDPNKLDVDLLNFNKNGTHYVIYNDKVNILYFVYNINAFDYCKTYILNLHITHNLYQTYITRFVTVEHPGIVDFINMIGYNETMFAFMCKNPYCIKFIEENKHNYHINLIHLAQNKAAIKLIRKHLHEFTSCCWDTLCINQSPEVIELLKENLGKIRWDILSSNPAAIKLLEENPTFINMHYLCDNPVAIHLIEQRIDKMDKTCWIQLSKNPSAIHILEKNKDKIDWYSLSQNPAIFEEDFKQLSIKRTNILLEELMAKTLHPKRIQYWLENGLTINDI
jgi:hypothetical protein